MSDVLLVNCSVKYGEVARGFQFYPPMGLNYLAAGLERRGVKVSIIDLGVDPLTTDQLCDAMAEGRTRLVGFSAVSPQIHNAMRFIRAVRSRFGREVSIALGGYHVSNDPTFLERHPEVDFAVTGDGDITFLELAEQTLGGERVSGTFPGRMVQSLDDLPWPAYHLTPLERYRDIGLTRYPTLATRGCPFNCVFCSRSAMSSKVRFRSVDNILEEMAANYGVFQGRYEFADESFTLRRKNVIALCEALLKWGRPVSWSAGGVRLDQIDAEMLELMWRSGCRTFFVGVESGSERVRNEIVGKNLTDKQLFDAFKLLDRFGFEVEISIVLGHPTETEEEMRQSVMFPAKLKKMGFKCITQAGLKPAVPMPGSRLWDIAIAEGKIPPDFIDRYCEFEYGEDFWQVWPTYVPDGLTVDRIRELRKKGYMAYYLRPEYIWRRLMRDLRDPKCLMADLKEFWSMIRKGHSTVSLTE
jgi:radical SAM superfamily enzyme YgiQ (UPF0313 family)